ncbi:ATP synthase subunit C lysine N-methyltransferase-like [Macrosteles quadrilineatus]|uniref:ATP synthase subunit C lysine N-methyltransferase-like n=1 Tax=Macrosteles quadrilineatus TaxID=74068 RepID=UPI0023E2BF4F|nr:ATP synthase subunit C lysine N-methyltransferase-like [Macrosteles quadrilineatus]
MSEVEGSLKSTNLNKSGLFLIGISGGAAVALTVLCAPFVSPALRRICLPYVPATTVQVENVLSALRGRSGHLVDIGSGDGRIVLAAAASGFKADGVELNPWLVFYSRLSALKAGLSSKTSFHRKDLWRFSLRPYNNIVIFGVEEMMAELEQKMNEEVSKDAHVVACRFPLPNRTPDQTIGSGVDTVWLYRFR